MPHKRREQCILSLFDKDKVFVKLSKESENNENIF